MGPGVYGLVVAGWGLVMVVRPDWVDWLWSLTNPFAAGLSDGGRLLFRLVGVALVLAGVALSGYGWLT